MTVTITIGSSDGAAVETASNLLIELERIGFKGSVDVVCG